MFSSALGAIGATDNLQGPGEADDGVSYTTDVSSHVSSLYTDNAAADLDAVDSISQQDGHGAADTASHHSDPHGFDDSSITQTPQAAVSITQSPGAEVAEPVVRHHDNHSADSVSQQGHDAADKVSHHSGPHGFDDSSIAHTPHAEVADPAVRHHDNHSADSIHNNTHLTATSVADLHAAGAHSATSTNTKTNVDINANINTNTVLAHANVTSATNANPAKDATDALHATNMIATISHITDAIPNVSATSTTCTTMIATISPITDAIPNVSATSTTTTSMNANLNPITDAIPNIHATSSTSTSTSTTSTTNVFGLAAPTAVLHTLSASDSNTIGTRTISQAQDETGAASGAHALPRLMPDAQFLIDARHDAPVQQLEANVLPPPFSSGGVPVNALDAYIKQLEANVSAIDTLFEEDSWMTLAAAPAIMVSAVLTCVYYIYLNL